MMTDFDRLKEKTHGGIDNDLLIGMKGWWGGKFMNLDVDKKWRMMTDFYGCRMHDDMDKYGWDDR